MANRSRVWFLSPAVSSLGLLSCGLGLLACMGDRPDTAGQSAPSATVGAAPQAASPTTVAAGEPAPAPAAPAAAPAAMPAAGAAATVLASSETNWGSVVAEVTEFRRKGNTLTAKVRLRNEGQERTTAEVKFDEVYVMDAANARKYEALRDEKGVYIASLHSGFNDRWYEYLDPGDQHLLWVKFPAPPPEVTAATLQLPSVPPFEDLAIQDR